MYPVIEDRPNPSVAQLVLDEYSTNTFLTQEHNISFSFETCPP